MQLLIAVGFQHLEFGMGNLMQDSPASFHLAVNQQALAFRESFDEVCRRAVPDQTDDCGVILKMSGQ